MGMKVAFTGAHGTGKTTLVKALFEQLAAMEVSSSLTPEVPRVVCDLVADTTYFRRGNNTFLRQMLILMGQPIYEIAQAKGASTLLCDRAILDHWAYTEYLFAAKLKDSEALVAKAFVTKHMASYDYVFYVPIEFGPKDDGTREGDGAFQLSVDGKIRELLAELDIPHHVVSGSVDERVGQVLQIILPTN